MDAVAAAARAAPVNFQQYLQRQQAVQAPKPPPDADVEYYHLLNLFCGSALPPFATRS